MNNRMTHLASQAYIRQAMIQLLFCTAKETGTVEIEGVQVPMRFTNKLLQCRCKDKMCDPQARATIHVEEE